MVLFIRTRNSVAIIVVRGFESKESSPKLRKGDIVKVGLPQLPSFSPGKYRNHWEGQP